jgi:hypothetical protein
VYQLCNTEDLTKNIKDMSEGMRQLCRTGTSECTKLHLRQVYSLGDEPVAREEDDSWCCMHHDLLRLAQT